MGKKQILVIDDDRLPMEYYISRLQKSNYDVLYYLNPDDMFKDIGKEKPHIDGIILDIMLPPGQKYKDKPTNQGLRTGVFLLCDLLGEYPNIPIIVFTNVRNPKTLAEFSQGELLKTAFKPDYAPKKLVELLDEMLNQKKK